MELLYVAGLVFVREAFGSGGGLLSYFIRVEDVSRSIQT